ncbi:hypothetical protein IAT40_003373 [Kwoniella sp. CBS 6097]
MCIDFKEHLGPLRCTFGSLEAVPALEKVIILPHDKENPCQDDMHRATSAIPDQRLESELETGTTTIHVEWLSHLTTEAIEVPRSAFKLNGPTKEAVEIADGVEQGWEDDEELWTSTIYSASERVQWVYQVDREQFL